MSPEVGWVPRTPFHSPEFLFWECEEGDHETGDFSPTASVHRLVPFSSRSKAVEGNSHSHTREVKNNDGNARGQGVSKAEARLRRAGAGAPSSHAKACGGRSGPGEHAAGPANTPAARASEPGGAARGSARRHGRGSEGRGGRGQGRPHGGDPFDCKGTKRSNYDTGRLRDKNTKRRPRAPAHQRPAADRKTPETERGRKRHFMKVKMTKKLVRQFLYQTKQTVNEDHVKRQRSTCPL